MPPGDAGYCRHLPAQRRALLTVRRMYAARREGLVSRDRYAQKRPLLGTPHALRKQNGHGNGAAMQSMENDGTVFHPSHSRLEDADEARVSHIPTTMATRLDKKDKQLPLLHLRVD